MPERFPIRSIGARCALLSLLGGLLLLAGCDRIKSKLDRLANAGREESTAPAAEPLTEEEQRLNAILDHPELFDAAEPAPAPKAVPFELNKSAVVSILGYHDFKERGGEAMVISAEKFRQQMQFIKDSNVPVVPLEDVVAWKAGRKNIPEECFVITMDDGWEGVYRHAWPVLKEFGFPFTVYLYKKYVNIGGRSLSWAQIREMMDSGLCTVGSHSVSHDSMTARKGRSEEDHTAWLREELTASKTFLESNLGITCTSFAYPYGNYNEAIRDLAREAGYTSMVTVNGSKVRWDTDNGELGRFIIHGVNDSVFQLAVSFRGRGPAGGKLLAANAVNEQGAPLVKLRPDMNATTKERMPRLEADLSGLGPLAPDSIKMHIAGIGMVQPSFEPATGLLSYQPPSRFRREQCEITITFTRQGAGQPETLLWTFKVDLAASYLPQ